MMSGRVILGIIVFLGIAALPLLYNNASGDSSKIPKPEPVKPEIAKQCVRDTEYMRTSHMVLLNNWRDNIVREGEVRKDKTGEGKEYWLSLQKGCMNCHSSKVKFCDECHTYAAVKPYCWDCHIQPKENM